MIIYLHKLRVYYIYLFIDDIYADDIYVDMFVIKTKIHLIWFDLNSTSFSVYWWASLC